MTLSLNNLPTLYRLLEDNVANLIPDTAELGTGKTLLYDPVDTYFSSVLTKEDYYALAEECKLVGDAL